MKGKTLLATYTPGRFVDADTVFGRASGASPPLLSFPASVGAMGYQRRKGEGGEVFCPALLVREQGKAEEGGGWPFRL